MSTRKRKGDGVQLLNCKKRKETLFRKCHELTVKSDAGVSLVCIGPDGEIEAWPNHEKAKAILTMHREKQAGKMKEKEKEKHSYDESESEEKKKLSADSLMNLWREIDLKLETLEEKIKILSMQKVSDFCDSSVNNSSGNFMEIYDWESYGQPWVSSAELNQPTQFIEDSMAVPADKDYSFITENFAVNHVWEPAEIEFLGAQDYYLGNDLNRLLQW